MDEHAEGVTGTGVAGAAAREERTFLSGGETCAAWLYRPEGAGPHPVVVMAHGFGGIRAAGLAAYAERFRAAGLAAWVFDYRSFGDSGGEPRQVLEVAAQLDDYRAAVAAVRAEPDLDGERVALWGTSFSGGHVLRLAAEDPSIRAVVAQVPFVGGADAAVDVAPEVVAELAALALADTEAATAGGEPVMVPIVGPPGSTAVITAPGAQEGYEALAPEGAWRNEVAARALFEAMAANPGEAAASVRCPLLVQVAERDAVTPAEATRRAVAAAPQATLTSFDLDHFDIYLGEPFEAAVTEQTGFLLSALG